MKLHSNTTETKTGLIFKKQAWKMDAQIELSPGEARILKAHPKIAKMTLVDYTAPNTVVVNYSVGSLIEGLKDLMFLSIQAQTEFEASLREGCAKLKEHLLRHAEVGSGPTTIEF